jgi:hypothetical protein
VRWLLATAVLAVAAWGCGGDGGEDDLLRRAIEAVSPAGHVMHLEGREFYPGHEADAEPISVWIDGDRDLFRYERRGEGPWGQVLHGKVGDGWEWTEYNEENNSVDEGSMRDDSRTTWGNPALLALEYLAAAMVGGWRVVGSEERDGRELVVLEARTPWEVDASGFTEGADWLSTVSLEKGTLWPVRQEVRMVSADGEVGEALVVEFDTVGVLSPNDLSADFFSRDAVRGLAKTLDEQMKDASGLGFTLYELAQVRPPPQTWDVVLSYELYLNEGGLTPMRIIPAVRIYEGVGNWQPQLNTVEIFKRETTTVEGRDVAMAVAAPGDGSGRLEHSAMVILDGTTVEITTSSARQGGPDLNPFNNRDAIIELIRALEPAE